MLGLKFVVLYCQIHSKKFKIFITVKNNIVVIWVISCCTLVGACQCFGDTYCPHLQVGPSAASTTM